MPILIALFARWGVAERLRKPLAIVSLVLAAVLLSGAAIGFFFHFHDKRVIETHEAVQAAKVTTTELEAERTANANDEARREQRETQTKDLNDARDEAQRSNPDEAAKSAGPSTRAVLDGLRRQAAGNQHAPAK